MTTGKTTKKPRAKKAAPRAAATGAVSKAVSASVHRSFVGVVTRISGLKTVRVAVKTTKEHSKFRKQYTTQKAYLVHDEACVAKSGNVVRFEECRPMSASKRWRLVAILAERA